MLLDLLLLLELPLLQQLQVLLAQFLLVVLFVIGLAALGVLLVVLFVLALLLLRVFLHDDRRMELVRACQRLGISMERSERHLPSFHLELLLEFQIPGRDLALQLHLLLHLPLGLVLLHSLLLLDHIQVRRWGPIVILPQALVSLFICAVKHSDVLDLPGLLQLREEVRLDVCQLRGRPWRRLGRQTWRLDARQVLQLVHEDREELLLGSSLFP
mmetsp:Transcript_20379/g.50943  ORF Transcript_20379/g.50943 Transcript_20379/m.50943 type:complete len:214 (+) Transcript_20379:4022-4663(+)